MNIHRRLSQNFCDLKVFYKVFHKLWKSMLITLLSVFYAQDLLSPATLIILRKNRLPKRSATYPPSDRLGIQNILQPQPSRRYRRKVRVRVR